MTGNDFMTPGALVRRLCLIGAVLLTAASAAAQTRSAEDKATLARIETYLNGVKSISSRFVQSSSNGSFAQGRLYVQRPKQLRLDYDPPSALQVYADGYWLVYVDNELEEATHVPLSRTPAAFLVAKDVKLSGKVTVTKIARDAKTVRLEVVQTDEPDAGAVVLTFDRSPVKLLHWTVIDPQGVHTQVALVRPVFNKPLKDKLFQFDPDRFERPELQQ